MTRKIRVMRLAPRQRIAPTNNVLMFFHVGRVKRGENVTEKINHHELVLRNIENIKRNIEKRIIERKAFEKKIETEKNNKKMDMRIIKKV